MTGKRMHILLLCLVVLGSVGCKDQLTNLLWPADGFVRGIRIHCDPHCPPLKKVERTLVDMAALWEPHLDFDPWRQWKHYAITFGEDRLIAYPQAEGATFHNKGAIWIHWPDGSPVGKAFEWELGLPLVEAVMPGSSEREKLEWRKARNLE